MKYFRLVLITVLFFTAGCRDSDFKKNFILIEGGTFIMGDVNDVLWEACLPAHEVALDYSFYLSKYEVTAEQFIAYLAETGFATNENINLSNQQLSLNYVSWYDAIAFCNYLSVQSEYPPAYRLPAGELLDANGNITDDITKAKGFRLPTEAEWEYASRGGHKSEDTIYSGGDILTNVGWYSFNSGGGVNEPGLLSPNELGLYDMSGNVWEWCGDTYSAFSNLTLTNPVVSETRGAKVIKGGGWNSSEDRPKVGDRDHRDPRLAIDNIGFRVALTAD